MEELLPTAVWTVAETLERCPQSAVVFFRHQMACVGCVMAPFDTLAEVTAVYGVPLERFLEELRHVYTTGNSPP